MARKVLGNDPFGGDSPKPVTAPAKKTAPPTRKSAAAKKTSPPAPRNPEGVGGEKK